MKSDFDGRVDVIPVSDPNIPSNAQRMMLIQMVQQIASQSPPGMFDMEAINRMLLESANVPDVEKLMPRKEEAVPQDPLSDIMTVSQGKPIKAFKGQDHNAHINVKMAFIQNPLNQQNPALPQIAAALQANIAEHSILGYQEQMEGMMRMAIDNPQIAEQLAQMPDPESALQLQAAQQLLQAAQQVAQPE